MNYQETIPAKLRGARAERRMLQSDVAVAVSKSEATIVNWENGGSMLPFDKACELADLYGVSLDRLAGRES